MTTVQGYDTTAVIVYFQKLYNLRKIRFIIKLLKMNL